MAWHDVAPAESSGQDAKIVELGDMRIAVLQPEDGFYSISDICGQEYASLSEGFRQGGKVVCSLHQADFDIRTGNAPDALAEADIAPCIRRIEGGAVQF